MLFQDIKIFYITSESSPRMVRYELIRTPGDNYLVKVFDEQHGEIASSKAIIQVDEFEISFASYREKYMSPGFQRAMIYDCSPSFEGYVELQLQQHRNKLD